jgi:hypothetical protein
MRYVTGAAGAAMLAASRVYFGTVGEAVRSMARIEKEVEPEEGLRGRYEEGYGKWVEEMRGRGIIGI